MSSKPGFKLNWKYALGEIALTSTGISLVSDFQSKNREIIESSKSVI